MTTMSPFAFKPALGTAKTATTATQPAAVPQPDVPNAVPYSYQDPRNPGYQPPPPPPGGSLATNPRAGTNAPPPPPAITPEATQPSTAGTRMPGIYTTQPDGTVVKTNTLPSRESTFGVPPDPAAFAPPPPPPIPEPTGPQTTGLQPGTPFMEGVDMTKPGAAETFYDANKDAYTTPGLGEQYAGNTMARYGTGNTPAVSNNTQGVLDKVMGAPGPQNVQNVYNDTSANVPANQGLDALKRMMGLAPELDLGANAGALEHFGANVPKTVDPNAGAGAYGAFQRDTAPGVALDEAQKTLGTFRGDVPLSQDAYYNNASRKANERLRTAMAARGVYGSSATDDQTREMEMELAADQAHTDADYRLRRASTESSLANSADAAKLSAAGYGLNRAQLGGNLASLVDAMTMEKGKYGLSRASLEGNLADATDRSAATEGDYTLKKAGMEGAQATNADQTALARSRLLGDLGGKADDQTLARDKLVGDLAQGADSSSAAASTNELNWTKGIADIMSGAQRDKLSGLVAGMGSAATAQGAQRTRGQDAFGNQITMGNALSGTMGDAFKDMSDRDIELLKEALGMSTGVGAEGYGQATRGQAQVRADDSAGWDRAAGASKSLTALVDAYQRSQNPAGSATA